MPAAQAAAPATQQSRQEALSVEGAGSRATSTQLDIRDDAVSDAAHINVRPEAAPHQPMQPQQLLPKRGYLIKSPVHGWFFSQRRSRFFECTESHLEWFLDEKRSSGLPRGRMRLAGATIELRSDDSGVSDALLVTVHGETLELRGEGLSDWAAALKQRADI